MSYVSALGFTARDIQPKNVRTDADPHNQNKIRRAWVLHCDETSAKQLQSLTPEIKFMLYEVIDEDVNDKWLEMMKAHVKSSVEAGAKFIPDPYGPDRLEDEYCVNADDQLLEAAEIVAAQIPEYIKTLPESIQKQMIAC